MADLTVIAGDTRLSTAHAPFRLTLTAGEDIVAGSPCYQGDTGVYTDAACLCLSVEGDTGVGASQFDGVAVLDTAAGETVTLFQIGSVIRYEGQSFTIGDFYYCSDTSGLISDAALVTGEKPILKAISADELMVVRMARPV